MSINAINTVTTPKANEVYLRNLQNVNFQAKATNSLERAPQQDTVEKKGMSTGGKIAIGAVALTGAAALIDAVACKGRHIKSILGITDDVAGKAVSQTSQQVKNSTQQVTQNPALKKQAEKIVKEVKKLEEQADLSPARTQCSHFWGEYKSGKITSNFMDSAREYTHVMNNGETVRILENPVESTKKIFVGDKLKAEIAFSEIGNQVTCYDDLGRQVERYIDIGDEVARFYERTYSGGRTIERSFINNELDRITVKNVNANGTKSDTLYCIDNGMISNCSVKTNSKTGARKKEVKLRYSAGELEGIQIVTMEPTSATESISSGYFDAVLYDGEVKKVSKTKVNPDFSKIVDEFNA